MLSRYEKGGRRVYSAGSHEFPSVTALLGLPNKPWLLPWVTKVTAEAAVDVMPTVEGKTKGTKLATIKKEAKERRFEKANYGSEVHKIVDWMLEGKEVPADTDESVRADAQAAVDFLESSKLSVAGAERAVANFRVGYAGTMDCLALDEHGKHWVVDWKTGRIGADAFYQCVAYACADHIWSEENSRWVEYELYSTVGGCVVVNLSGGKWTAYRHPIDKWDTAGVLRYISNLVLVHQGERELQEFCLPEPD